MGRGSEERKAQSLGRFYAESGFSEAGSPAKIFQAKNHRALFREL
jgi:hypothetical protein